MMSERSDWIEKRVIIPLLAMTLPEELPPVKHPIFEGVPSIMQFAKTDVQKNIIRKINSTDRLGAAVAFPWHSGVDSQDHRGRAADGRQGSELQKGMGGCRFRGEQFRTDVHGQGGF
ncbi:MAG TPA: hypothetical protein VGR30_15770 [Candidatus Binatia bacterium]|jgi:hypothetical protein|nr:hypothetical protein [Candidatus Binatia bacterium]